MKDIMNAGGNHYTWLDRHLLAFFDKLELLGEDHRGIVVAHGDKCYTYRYAWEKAGIPFEHGVALYLLTYCYPFDLEVRNTELGWVSPQDWVTNNYLRFKRYLPAVLDEGERHGHR